VRQRLLQLRPREAIDLDEQQTGLLARANRRRETEMLDRPFAAAQPMPQPVQVRFYFSEHG
jgi:hypothetical protein